MTDVMAPGRVVIVGAGAAGLAAACELARRGVAIDLIALAAPRRTVVASSGDAIAAAAPGDEAGLAAHARDATPAGADATLAAAIRALVAAAPDLVTRLADAGVPFAPDAAGAPARLRGSGHLADRLTTAGPHTKREVIEALDRQLAVAARTGPGRIRRLEGWEVVDIVVHEGACVGVVAQDLRSMEIHAVPARAVLLASGGFGGGWRASAAPPSAVGSATAAALRAGASLVDVDAVDLAPLAMVGSAKRHPVSDFVRSAGARVWVPIDPEDDRRARDVPSKERRELLRPLDEEAGHLVSPAISARTIARALFVEPIGIRSAGELDARVYVDLGHLGGALSPEVRGEIDRLARITRIDLAEAPARVAPAVTDTLGGLAVGFELDGGEVVDGSAENHATDVAGLYAAGSAASAYHARTRLPGQRLLEALVGGELAARAIATFCARPGAEDRRSVSRAALTAAEERARSDVAAMRARPRAEPVQSLRARLGEALDVLVGLGPASSTEQLASQVQALAEQAAACSPDDDAARANRGVIEVRRLEATVLLARSALAAAAARHGDDLAPIRVRLEDGVPKATRDAKRAPATDDAQATEDAP